MATSTYTPVFYSSYSTPTTSATTTTLPLTTIFTPPASCVANSRFVQATWSDGWRAYGYDFDPACYPEAYPSTATDYLVYSPGVCPSGWNYAATSITTNGYQGGYATTSAVCCPPYFYGVWAEAQQCQQQITSSWPGLPSYTGGTNGYVAFERAITVAWQSSDLSNFSPASAPSFNLALQEGQVTLSSSSTSSLSGSGSSGSSSPTSTSPASSSSSSSSSSLSTGAAVGIGVGGAAVAISLFAIGWVMLRRHYLRRAAATAAAAAAAGGANKGSPSSSSPQPPPSSLGYYPNNNNSSYPPSEGQSMSPMPGYAPMGYAATQQGGQGRYELGNEMRQQQQVYEVAGENERVELPASLAVVKGSGGANGGGV